LSHAVNIAAAISTALPRILDNVVDSSGGSHSTVQAGPAPLGKSEGNSDIVGNSMVI
jgi:hypothetical protein